MPMATGSQLLQFTLYGVMHRACKHSARTRGSLRDATWVIGPLLATIREHQPCFVFSEANGAYSPSPC